MLEAFIDLSSTCTTLRVSEAQELGLPYDAIQKSLLKGFENSLVESVGLIHQLKIRVPTRIFRGRHYRRTLGSQRLSRNTIDRRTILDGIPYNKRHAED